VQLVAFEGARSWSVLFPADDRWLVLAGGHRLPGEGDIPSFEAYMLEPCGGGEVEGPADVGYENLSTGESWVLMPRVVSNVVSTTVELAESTVFEGRRPAFYLVEEDRRTALSVTLLPER
jgi:hypothetical protein